MTKPQKIEGILIDWKKFTTSGKGFAKELGLNEWVEMILTRQMLKTEASECQRCVEIIKEVEKRDFPKGEREWCGICGIKFSKKVLEQLK
jgi:hypothetical protein